MRFCPFLAVVFGTAMAHPMEDASSIVTMGATLDPPSASKIHDPIFGSKDDWMRLTLSHRFEKTMGVCDEIFGRIVQKGEEAVENMDPGPAQEKNDRASAATQLCWQRLSQFDQYFEGIFLRLAIAQNDRETLSLVSKWKPPGQEASGPYWRDYGMEWKDMDASTSEGKSFLNDKVLQLVFKMGKIPEQLFPEALEVAKSAPYPEPREMAIRALHEALDPIREDRGIPQDIAIPPPEDGVILVPSADGQAWERHNPEGRSPGSETHGMPH